MNSWRVHPLYAAGSWSKERRILICAEHGSLGRNPRFVVTLLEQKPEELYRNLSCARGEMKNRIKEQMQLFSGRSSAHHWWANQHRLLLSALAYHLLERMRSLALQGTRLAQAECRTLWIRFVKIGAVISRNTRSIKVHLNSHCFTQDLYWKVAIVFAPDEAKRVLARHHKKIG